MPVARCLLTSDTKSASAFAAWRLVPWKVRVEYLRLRDDAQRPTRDLARPAG